MVGLVSHGAGSWIVMGAWLWLGLAAPAMTSAQTAEGDTQEAHADDQAETLDASRDEEARNLFQAGTVAFEAARYDDALRRWQESYELSGRTELLYNVGLAHDRLRHDGEAVESFEAFLAAHPDSPKAHEVRVRVAAIKTAQATSPKAAASTSIADDEATGPTGSDDRADDGQKRWYKKWWVWTIVSVAVVGTAVGIGASQAGGGAQVADPVMSTSGIDIMTFRR